MVNTGHYIKVETGHKIFDKQSNLLIYTFPIFTKTQISMWVNDEFSLNTALRCLHKTGVKKKFYDLIEKELKKQIPCSFYLIFHDTSKGVINHGAFIVKNKEMVIPFYFYRGKWSKAIIRSIGEKMVSYFKQQSKEIRDGIKLQSVPRQG